jgi:septum formation protein
LSKTTRKELPAFILASASPRRKEILHYFDFPFIVRPSRASESITNSLTPCKKVQKLARRKAQTVAEESPEAIILGADTLVIHGSEVFGKPKNINHARLMIQSLSSSTHQVLTGVALLKTDEEGIIIQENIFCESTRVAFGRIDEKLLERYLAVGNPLDKAGGYGIQDKWGAIFIRYIEGDFYNVMGLPVHALYQRLRRFAPEMAGRMNCE